MVRVHPPWRLSTAVSWLRPCIDHAWLRPGRSTQTAAPRSCAPSVRSLRQTASTFARHPRERLSGPGSTLRPTRVARAF